MTEKTPEIIDLVDDDTVQMMEVIKATEGIVEPAPEPTEAETIEAVKQLEHAVSSQIGKEGVDAITEALDEMDNTDPSPTTEESTQQHVVATAVVEEVLVAIEEDEPSWLETTLGPWVAHHRNGLGVWLLLLLALYVSLFASMVIQDGLRGLSERSPTATVRDLLWAVLMGIIVLLTIGKRY